jgi:hypothetical protein
MSSLPWCIITILFHTHSLFILCNHTFSIVVMIPNCDKCYGIIDASANTANNLNCAGVCNKRFHYECVDAPEPLHKYFAVVSGLFWKCPDCVSRCFSFDVDNLNHFLEHKFNSLVGNLKDTFLELKGDFLKMAPQLKHAAKSEPTFAEIAKNKIRPAVIIEPKDHALDSLSTKKVIAANINTRESDLQISSVKNVKNGDVLVGCSSTEDNSRFKQIAESKRILSLERFSLRVKIAGITQKY